MIDPNDYWVNNPLITPVNKALMYDNAIWMAKMDEQDRIIDLLEPLGCPENGIEHDCQNGLGYITAKDLIELIKGGK